MFAKLAFRNVKRQIGNYLIYFITVSLTVALMFAVNSAIFSKELLERARTISELKSGLISITVLVSLIVAFVLGYATSFMLKLRKREFGTYLTLGMTRRNILSVFVLEAMILCAASLATGLLLGLLFYQGLMAVVTNLMETEYTFAAYSLKGLLLTVGLVCVVFVLSSLTSALYLKRVSVYNLLHDDKKVEKKVKFSALWLAVTLLAFIVLIACCILFSLEVDRAMAGNGSGGVMFGTLAGLAASIVLFHVGAAKSIVNLLLKNGRFKSRGTNAFTLRQLSGKLSANAVMAGALAFLLAFAVIGANVSFVQKVSNEASLKKNYPFDIGAELDAGEEPAVPFEEAEEIISKYAEIEKRIYYSTYTSENSYLHSFTRWSGEGYASLYDSFITESDFNRLYGELGLSPIELNGGFKILSNDTRMDDFDFSAAVLEFSGERLFYKGMETDYPVLGYYYFLTVIPDDVAASLKPYCSGAVYTLKEGKFDARGLREALSYEYTVPDGQYAYERCDYQIKEYARMTLNANSAVFIVSALYIAVVFVFMAMAILALKTLSGISDDKKRYDVLYRLGADKREQSRTLFRQTFSFFFLPFALPMLLSVPTGVICMRIMRGGGFLAEASHVLSISAGIALAVTAIYVLYFTATYLVAKRSVIKE